MFDGSLKLDEEIENDSALVIDSNPVSRNITTKHLRDFGFGTVRHVARLVDGRNMLETQRFSLVICDYGLENEASAGLQLLEELRRENMLPFSTVFIMISGEATYAQVAEAAESALDGYLIRPFSSNSLAERIKEARRRKRVLGDIFESLERGDHDTAIDLCMKRFESRELDWLHAARIGGELLLRQDRNDDAANLFKAVVEAKSVPWARLGVARAHFADGEASKALREVEKLIEDEPENADAFDFLGQVNMALGQVEEARKAYERATELTPECVLRLQHAGTLSFYTEDYDKAAELLQQAWTVGKESRMFDVLSMLLIAFVRYEKQQASGVQFALDNIKRFSDAHPTSPRLRRFNRIAQVLVEVSNGRTEKGFRLARAVYADVKKPAFDMEAAMSVLSMLARLVKAGFPLDEFEVVGRNIAGRFAMARSTNHVLLTAAMGRPDMDAWLTEALTDTTRAAENAVDLTLKEDFKGAVASLLLYGEQTCNARLIELAGNLLKRHRDKIDGVEALIDTQGVLSRHYCAPRTHIAGIRRSGRSAGGMLVKT
jgi:tetratricopeptide (TPR) repeat protein